MDERTQQLLERLGLTTKDTTGAMQQLLSALSRTTSASNTQTNAATLTAQSLQQMQSSAQSTSSGLRNVLSIGTGVVSSFTSLTSSIYGADKAFTSVIPTLNFITSTFTKTVTAAGTALSGLSIRGLNIGRASEAAAAGVAATFEVLSDVIKFQIEGAQKVSDQFQELSKVGATFGGSIGTMGAVAAELRIPLLQFGRVITSNIESLSKMGGSITDAGYRVTAFGMDLYDKEDTLLALYGSIENISAGVADFMALQAGIGKSQTTDYNAQRNAIKEYLIRQKELTALTGQSADVFKKAEEKRQTSLSYQLQLRSETGKDTALNMQEAFAIAGAKFNEEAQQYLQAYYSNNVGPEMEKFAAVNDEVARVMRFMSDNRNLDATEFKRQIGQYLQQNADSFMAFAESRRDLAQLPQALMPDVVQSQVNMGSALIKNMDFFRSAVSTMERLIAEGGRLRDTVNDPATKAFVDAERDRSKIQREIDTNVLTNMQNIGGTIRYLNEMTLSIVKAQGNINELLEKLKQMPMEAQKFNDAVGAMVDNIFKRMGFDLPPNRADRGSGSDPLSILREIFSGSRTLPVSVNPGQSPIPVTIVSNTASPASPAVPTSAVLSPASVVTAMADTKLASESSKDDTRNLSAEVSRLQTQLAAVTNNNTTATQLVTALTDQNSLMKGLNDKMDRMVDSNGRIFEALA